MAGISFVQAIRDNLTLQGETSKDIIAMFKKLTDQDKAELIAEFSKNGIEINAPVAATK